MYIATFEIEYVNEIMGELIGDYLADDVFSDALNIFLSMFQPDGRLRPDFNDELEIIEYCRLCYARLEDIRLEDLDGNFSMVLEQLINAFLDNICGFYGNPPTHPSNLESFISVLALYYQRGENVCVVTHKYNPYSNVLKLFVY